MAGLKTVPSYGEPLASLVMLGEAETLGGGISREPFREQLEALTPGDIFPGATIVDHDSARCCISAIWLLHHFLDESHQVSQDISTSSGSYWHAIMHRREGDYSNAKYWFRRVANHPVYERLASSSQQLLEQDQLSGLLPVAGGRWDPFMFVDMCEDVVLHDKGNRLTCQSLSRLEWMLLFDNCYHSAIGST